MGFYENVHKCFGQVFEEGVILDCVACGCIVDAGLVGVRRGCASRHQL